jgi:Fic family protein
MKADDFRDSPSGHLVPTIKGAMAFVPNPLPPPQLDMVKLALPLDRATHALGELSGIGRTLPNPHLLIRPFIRVEAIASSKIEGTVTTMQELLFLEAEKDSTKARTDTREVDNYTKALDQGLKLITQIPLSKRLICELHKTLLAGVAAERGGHFIPGEFKTEQNWIGARLIENARFVPPPPTQTLDAISDLEKYIHEADDVPFLIKLATVHYQFETIHPFPDGNGRIGRLIIPLMLCERKAMSQPLLYLSSFFERNYDKYIDTMFDVSRSGAWEAWILFFLEGVEVTAKNAIKKSHALQDLHKTYFSKIQAARSSALLGKLIDSVFYIPAITIPIAMYETKVSYNSAKNNIKRLVELGILTPGRVTNRPPRPQWFFADEIMNIAREPQ